MLSTFCGFDRRRTRAPRSGAALVTILAAALATATGCADHGSDVPTSTIRGNLAAIEASEGDETSSRAAVGGVHVSIEGTSYEAVTGPRGEFAIESPFSGLGTLVFRREASDFVAWLGVDVPPGGTVTLRDGRCSRERKLCRTASTEVERPDDAGGVRRPSGSWATSATRRAMLELAARFGGELPDGGRRAH